MLLQVTMKIPDDSIYVEGWPVTVGFNQDGRRLLSALLVAVEATEIVYEVIG